MTVRAVEGKKLWEGGTAITVDNENKIISLNLRDENNLIIYDEGDDEIYVDLQLPDGIRPTDAFPVGITTGRVLVADDWDVTGTLICAKTTSGDNIKVLYGDDNKLYVDNGTGIFKQVYLKPEVDALLATYATIAYVDSHDTVVSATAPETPTEGMLWYNTTTGKLKVYNGTDWDDVGGGGGGGSYTAGNGIIIDQNDEISVDTTVVATQTDLSSKQDELVSGTNIKTVNSTSLLGSGDVTVQETLVSGTNIKTVNSNSLLGSGDVSINEVPSGGTDGQVLTKVSGSPAWANPTGGGGDVSVSTDTGNELTTGAKLWLGLESDFSSITTPDSNTMYIQYVTDGGGGWQPGANTILYYSLDGNVNDGSGNGWNGTRGNGAYYTTGIDGKQCADFTRANHTWITSSCNTAPKTVSFFLKRVDVAGSSQDWRQVIGMTTDWSDSWNIRAYPNNPDGTLRGYWQTTTTNGNMSAENTNIANTYWHHYCLTTDDTTTYFYVDGNLFMSRSGGITANSTLLIGQKANTSDHALNGYMQHIILESVYWTQSDIQDYLSNFSY